jgi:hypothetical protein
VPIALVIQLAKRMRHAVLSSVDCPALQMFFTLYHKRRDFREKVIELYIRVLIVPTNFVCNASHPKKNSSRYCHVYV